MIEMTYKADFSQYDEIPSKSSSKSQLPYQIQLNNVPYVDKKKTYEYICKMGGSKQKLDYWAYNKSLDHKQNNATHIIVIASLLVAVFSTSACFVFLSFPEPLNFIFGILLIAPMSACLMRIIHWKFSMGVTNNECI